MLLSAGGSLVWKEDGLCAPSSYRYVPLWTKVREETSGFNEEVVQLNLVIFTQKAQKTSL